ncbi:hypothetical protein [Halalkalibacter sp. APA_J-10(15)]|uniref:hypothetical protein n=1 Tax=unclassified Halalkalibacter TaxID=2893063 RepID=UPI001FF6988E|nr:hypothetical protein [Halalkalibacter sp. APA_J-10(15)]MCK0469948.1 hypothetical protein [Halalkalibacter sp. APA_J-10(15)]
MRDVLEQIGRLLMKDELRASFDPSKKQASENEVLIGFGVSNENDGKVLNHKGTKYASVTELVVDERTINDDGPMIGLEYTRFVMEDLSPDSCLAFILLCYRKLGGDINKVPVKWIDYVNRWESGDVKTTGTPFQSWGCLINALGHHYIRFHDGEVDQISFHDGLKACVFFTIDLLKANINPADVGVVQHSSEYHRAKALIHHEYQEYKQLLSTAECLQIPLPLQHSNRMVMVDAFIATERKPIGALKAFLRNDQERTYFKSGFGLMALYRPQAVGTGNDMVISVDPSIGVDLRDLWMELERLEEKKWQGERPSDQPRFPEVSSANEPWYHELGKYTIIAAPKQIHSQQLGSKLSWSDVTDAIWQVYHPAKQQYARPFKNGGALKKHCLLSECPPLMQRKDKQLIAMKWTASTEQQPLVLSPTMKRYLASLLLPKGHEPTLLQLPSSNSFTFLTFPGGFAVINRYGVLFFDDWSYDESHVEVYQTEFDHMVKRFFALSHLQVEIEKEVSVIWESLNHRKGLHPKGLNRLNDRLTYYKVKLRQTILETMPSSKDYYVQQFRIATEKMWGLESELDQLYTTVAEIESTISRYSEAGTNRLINGITIYGFPVLLFTGLFQFIFDDYFRSGSIHFIGIVLFICVTFLMIMSLKLFVNKRKNMMIRRKQS